MISDFRGSLQKSLFYANEIIRLGADNTRIYPTLVIKGLNLKALSKREYLPLSLAEAVEWIKQYYLFLI